MTLVAIAAAAAILVGAAAMGPLPGQDEAPGGTRQDRATTIAGMVQQVDEREIRSTVYALQNFTSRHYGQPGNAEASVYLFDRLSDIPGLEVEYQGGDLRNVIATLPGRNGTSAGVYMVGAHYDSVNEGDITNAPGATDNGGGVAIVLELARIMAQHQFGDTVRFALWNAEDGGADIRGSTEYARYAAASGLNITLYMNFDSACYDPLHRYVLDILSDERSRWVSELMTECNSLYGIGFELRYNIHTSCWSDHRAFWEEGYTAVSTHTESHGPAHTAADTVDKISTSYARKNCQLGMAVIADLAGLM